MLKLCFNESGDSLFLQYKKQHITLIDKCVVLGFPFGTHRYWLSQYRSVLLTWLKVSFFKHLKYDQLENLKVMQFHVK